MQQATLYAYPDAPKQPAVALNDPALIASLSQTLTEIAGSYGLPGIAAPHIQEMHALFVLNKEIFQQCPSVLINPKLVHKSGEQVLDTECLYFPGVVAAIKRPQTIELAYTDLDNEACTLKADGELAGFICYLMDCLEGKLILNHMSSLKRDLFLKKYNKYLKQNHCGADCDHEHH